MSEQVDVFTHLINAPEGAQRVESGAVLVDVRNPERLVEFGAIPGAVNIAKSALDDAFSLDATGGLSGVTSRDQDIVVFCGSPKGSQRVVNYLLEHGFTSVHHIDGGYSAWRDAGLPTEAPAVASE
jgi:rhodanese-related sulfurtransferase